MADQLYPRRIDSSKVAKGYTQAGSCTRRTVVTLDDETHDQIRAIAIQRHCSFAEVVRMLVEFGLEDLFDSTDHKPLPRKR